MKWKILKFNKSKKKKKYFLASICFADVAGYGISPGGGRSILTEKYTYHMDILVRGFPTPTSISLKFQRNVLKISSPTELII